MCEEHSTRCSGSSLHSPRLLQVGGWRERELTGTENNHCQDPEPLFPVAPLTLRAFGVAAQLWNEAARTCSSTEERVGSGQTRPDCFYVFEILHNYK